MAARSPEPITAAELLERWPPPARAVAEEVRALLRAAVPEATERANAGWRSLNWSHPTVGYFCGLFPLPHAVRVVFEFGVLLNDPQGLFTGGGAQVRWLDADALTPRLEEQIRAFVAGALALPASRAARLAMIEARRPRNR